MFLSIRFLAVLGIFTAQLGFSQEGNIQPNLATSKDGHHISTRPQFQCRNCGGPLPPSLPAGSKNICPRCGEQN